MNRSIIENAITKIEEIIVCTEKLFILKDEYINSLKVAIEALEKVENDETCAGCRYYENLKNWRNPYGLPGPCDQCRRCCLDMYEENNKWQNIKKKVQE